MSKEYRKQGISQARNIASQEYRGSCYEINPGKKEKHFLKSKPKQNEKGVLNIVTLAKLKKKIKLRALLRGNSIRKKKVFKVKAD